MMTDHHRMEILAGSLAEAANRIRLAVQLLANGKDVEAVEAMGLADMALLEARNAVTQWADNGGTVICPACRKEVANCPHLRNIKGEDGWHDVVAIGFRCRECGHEWGFGARREGSEGNVPAP